MEERRHVGWGAIRLPARLLAGMIRVYQLLISPWLGPRCRFYPSCSAYCHEAVLRFGLWRGTWLGVRRLVRCHPWHPGGVDLVPSVRGQGMGQDVTI